MTTVRYATPHPSVPPPDSHSRARVSTISFVKTRLCCSFLLLSTFFLSGCTTPEAVRKFTFLSAQASAQILPVVSDLSASCIRNELANRPPEEIEDVSEEVANKCKQTTSVEPQVLGALRVLTAYMNALNDLASDEAVTYDKQIDGIASAAATAGKFDDRQVNAVKGLAKFLADAAASGYQRKKLAEAIKRADADVATLCDSLSVIIGTDYGLELKVEQDSTRTRYKNTMQTDTAAAHILIQDQWRHDLDQLSNRAKAAADAQKLLSNIRDGHHQLAMQVDRWSAKDLYKELSPYSASIQTLINDFRTAF